MRNLRERSIKPLWVDDYYDGPLSGFCEYRGKRYYYVAQDEDWTYFLHPLMEETWKSHLSRHEDFGKYVGNHWDCNEEPRRLLPEEEWHKYYDKYKDVKLPAADELPPAYCYTMGDEHGRRERKRIRRGWRMERLKEARASSRSQTAART